MATRLTYFLGFILVIFLLLTTLYLQFYRGVEPCPLCSLQRIALVGIGIWLLLGTLLYQNRLLRHITSALITLTSLLGLVLAGRQIWLQQFPPANNDECGVGLQYMLHVLPLNEVMQKIFAGTAECTQRGFEFLSLTLAEWAAIWFVVFMFAGVYFLYHAGNKRP